MSAPLENQEGHELPDKVERTNINEIQQQNIVSTDPEIIDVGIESFGKSLFQSVSGVPQLCNTLQEPDYSPILSNPVMVSPTPRRVQFYPFADLETNFTIDHDSAITVPEHIANNITDSNSLIINTGENNTIKLTDCTDDNHKAINTTDNTDGINTAVNTTDNTDGNKTAIIITGSTDGNNTVIDCTDSIDDKRTSYIKNSDIAFDNVNNAKTISKVFDLSPTLTPSCIRYSDIPSKILEVTHTEPALQVQSKPELYDETLALFSQITLQSVEEINTGLNIKVESMPIKPKTNKSDTHIEHQHSILDTFGSLSQIESESPVKSGLESIHHTEPGPLVQNLLELSAPIELEQATSSKLNSTSQTETKLLVQKATKFSPSELEQTNVSKLEFISQAEMEPLVQKVPNPPPFIDSGQLISDEATTEIEPKAVAQNKLQPVPHSGHEPPTDREPTPSSQRNVIIVRDSPEPIAKPLKKKDPRGRKPKAVTNQSGPNSISKPTKIISAKVANTIVASTSNSAPMKRSERQADKKAALKAAEEEAQRQATAASIRLVEAQIAAETALQVEFSQQTKSAQQVSVRVSVNDNPVKVQDIIVISDTEVVPVPKKPVRKAPVKKTPLKKTKNSLVIAGAAAQDNFMGQTSTANIMLNPINTRSTKKNNIGKALIKVPTQHDTTEGDIKSEFNTSLGVRERRATSTVISYKDFDTDYSEDEAPRPKGKRKTSVKAKEASKNSSKPVEETLNSVAARPKRAKKTTSVVPIHTDADDEVKETEIAQIKISKKRVLSAEKDEKLQMLLQSRESKLTKVELRDLIPTWLGELSEEDKQELAVLLPKPDQVVKNKRISIRPDFGVVATNHFYEAAGKWQDVLFLGGFETKKEVAVNNVEEDLFKDENYEEYWGERIAKFKEIEHKMPRSKRVKGKGKATQSKKWAK